MKHRYFRSILCSIFIAAILSSCARLPNTSSQVLPQRRLPSQRRQLISRHCLLASSKQIRR